MATTDHHDPVLPMQTIRLAYEELCLRVNTALRTQIGDAARLKAHRDDCLYLMAHVHTVSTLMILSIMHMHRD